MCFTTKKITFCWSSFHIINYIHGNDCQNKKNTHTKLSTAFFAVSRHPNYNVKAVLRSSVLQISFAIIITKNAGCFEDKPIHSDKKVLGLKT